MSLLYVQSEGTAARRRVPLFLVDATDGITAETGEVGGQPQISKNGAAFTNTTATLTAVGNGGYYVELSAAELDTVGTITIRYKSANTTERQVSARVVALNINSTAPDVNVLTIAAAAANVIRDAVDDMVLRTGTPNRTLGGHLRRMDALFFGKVTGMLGALVQAFRPGGSILEFEAEQNLGAGTREEVDVTNSEA